MTLSTYNVAKLNLGKGDLDLETADLRVLLLTANTGASDPDNANLTAVLSSATEASDGSYARVALGTVSGAQDDANDRADFTVANADFGSLDNETITAVVVYVHVDGTAANDWPVGYDDTDFPKVANGAGFVVDLSADLFRIT